MPVTMIQECLLLQVNAMNMLAGEKDTDVCLNKTLERDRKDRKTGTFRN